jgi:hypothetical protein
MAFDFDRSTSAVVCFWNHASFSACVVLDEVTPKELAILIDHTVRNPAMQPARAAAIFANMAFEVAEIALANVPPAANTGATLARIHSADNAPGGMGFVLVDQEQCELIVFGGTGWDEDYNTFQARHIKLEDVLARIPKSPVDDMTVLEMQQTKTTMMRDAVDTMSQEQIEAASEDARKKKVTRKRGK